MTSSQHADSAHLVYLNSELASKWGGWHTEQVNGLIRDTLDMLLKQGLVPLEQEQERVLDLLVE